MQLSVSEIKELMGEFRKNRLGGMTIQDGEFLLRLEAAEPAAAAAAPPAVAAPPEETPAEAPARGSVIKSPIVGTFYAAAAPDKPPFVSAGDSVKKGDVLFIIESMKLMNEVTSELDGTVAEILVQNGQTVEYGQPILTIE